MVVFQTVAHIGFRTVLTGAVFGLCTAAIAVAQTSGTDPLPDPQNRPSVESYSLPPGPSDNSNRTVLQGPVDAEIPVVPPPVITPRTAPAKAPAISISPPADRAAADRSIPPTKQPSRQATAGPEAADKSPSPAADPPSETPVVAENERMEPPVEPAATIEETPAAATSIARPISSTATTMDYWQIILAAALLAVGLAVIFLWRVRRSSVRQAVVAEPGEEEAVLTNPVIEPVERLQPVSAIAIDFQPHSANATLFNAVVGFELALSNHGSEVLTEILVHGAMVQAREHGATDPALTDLTVLKEITTLPSGDSEKITSEFRIPLASIHPIMFRSQALFVPQIQISIEFTDASGFRHFQTAAYLVGQEHQPPRPKLAPFRLDTGPRSFAPLGQRLLPAG